MALLLGSTLPHGQSAPGESAAPGRVDQVRASERLAAIRDAVSDAVGPSAGKCEKRLDWAGLAQRRWRLAQWRVAQRRLAQWRLAQRRLGQFLAQLVNGLRGKANLTISGGLLVLEPARVSRGVMLDAHPQVE